ncbi:MAG: hypothetical protein JNK76_07100 [Planctomycetales bacterium]|nr:hypothetical protein [Planctomycetales bacterium]MBN8624126.1 hypothetical protein [Planctomycetota bacterium]
MAASFFFACGEAYTLSNHGFYAIVDRIRQAASMDETKFIEPIIRPL